MTSDKPSSLTRTTLILPLLIVATILVAGPLAVAQQTTPPPLTTAEQEEQDRIQETKNITTQFLEQGQKQIGDIIFTPRWSGPTWIEPATEPGQTGLGVLFAPCLPGEFAVSGEMILGSTDLTVLESYSVSLPEDLTTWVMIVQNENEEDRLPGAAGVICASDEDVDALYPQGTVILNQNFQQQINNLVQEFNIENTNIANVLTNVQNTIINQYQNAINVTGNVNQNQSANVNQNLNLGTIVGDLGQDDGGVTPPQANDTTTTTTPPPPPAAAEEEEGTTTTTTPPPPAAEDEEEDEEEGTTTTTTTTPPAAEDEEEEETT
jgi:hypothetical protein